MAEVRSNQYSRPQGYAPAPGGIRPPGAPAAPGAPVLAEAPKEERTLVTMASESGEELKSIEDLHIDELLHTLVEKNSSDLHISPGIPPCYRLDGALQPMMYEPMTAPQTQQMMYDILTDDQIQRFEETWELDFSYALQRKARFRVNVFKDKGSVAAALRLIPTKMPTLQELGYSNVLEKLTKLKRGLVLVTGPTGSGKSTTLAAMIHTINTTRSEHIITIEDPVEYLHVHRMSVINQRELGQDTKSFQAALRASLREDPDVILVGEMRDLETMQLAISAAETGHLVFATLHTNSAASTVDRIIDAFPAGQQAQVRLQLANNIQAVICQTLCPRADGPGRVGVQEIMLATPAIRNLVREGKAHQITSTIQTSGGVGMTTLDQALRDAYLARKISYDEAIVRAQNADELKKMISASGGDAGSPGARPPAR